MRKQTKKLLSWVLSGALALGLVSNVNLATVSADDGTVVIDDVAWSYGGDGDARIQFFNNWGGDDVPEYLDGVEMTGIQVDFTISGVEKALNALATDSAVAYLNIDGTGVSVWDDPTNDATSETTQKTISQDGAYTLKYESETAFTVTNFFAVRFQAFDSLFGYGEDGKSTPGENGPTFSDVKVTLTGVKEAEVVVPSGPAFYPKEEVWDVSGVHAYITYQVAGSYNYRDDYNPKKIGKQGTYDYALDSNGEFAGTAKDVLILENGTYTIDLQGIDLKSNPNAAGYFNWLAIAADVDCKTYEGVKFTDVSLKIDGEDIAPSKELAELNNSSGNYYKADLANHYSFDEDGVEDPWDAINEAGSLPLPTQSIEITFTVSGLDKALQDLKDGNYVDPVTGEKVKNENAAGSSTGVSTPSPTPTATAGTGTNATPTPTPKASAAATVKKGQTAKDTKGNSYTVSKAGKTPTVTITKVSAKTKKAKKISVPNTVKVNGVTCKVTAIGKNAYKGSKATTIVIPKNVTTIEKGAFANCKKLKTLQVKGNLKKVAKGAFKGCKKKITVKSAKKSKKANVKALKKSGYKKFK